MSDVLPAAYLEVEIDKQLRTYSLANDRIFRIGRSDKNDIVLDDDLTSRNHAMMQRSDEGLFYITDLGSSNGTFVNGTRVSAPLILRPGDRIGVGNHELRFHQETVAGLEPMEEPDELQTTNILFAQSLITVLVADIRDFTGLARRIEASQLSQLTGTFFREAGKALQERGAWAQKYIGDAVMAVWLHKKRAPEPRELIAIYDGLSCMATIADRLQGQFGLQAPLRIGAGIDTGWASVGNVGSIASSDYTALGDVVNKTFRLESATKEISCDLILGQGAYEILAACIQAAPFFEARSIKLKGYDEPATAYSAQLSSLTPVLDALHHMGAC